MKERKNKTRTPIMAAGGIVLRGDREPQFAVVQLRKMGAWVLPKGKLAADEDAIAAARREVLEETGYRVAIHEFVGTLAYEVSGRPKVVQFWRMQALGEPIGNLMRDVKAVRWLALEKAIDQLTHARERAFLQQVGPMALKSDEQSARRFASGERPADKNLVQRSLSAARFPAVDRSKPLAPVAAGNADDAEPIERDIGARAGLVPAANAGAPRPSAPSDEATEMQTAADRNLIEKTLKWFRQVAMPQRSSPD